MAEHNARAGRRTAIAKGRSFDAVFEESMRRPTTIVRRASEAQRSLWLLASEAIKTQKNDGRIHFAGNRYWTKELNQHMGQMVTIRFDPDNLHSAVQVYDLKNRFICEAPCLSDAGFADQDAARLHARDRGEYRKAQKALAKAHKRFNDNEIAALLKKGQRAAEKPDPVHPNVTRLVTPRPAGNLAPKVEPGEQADFEQSFSKALSRLSGAAEVLPFPKGNTTGR